MSGTLTEADITQAGFLGNAQDVGDGVGDVVPGEVINAVVPEFVRIRVMVNRLS